MGVFGGKGGERGEGEFGCIGNMEGIVDHVGTVLGDIEGCV